MGPDGAKAPMGGKESGARLNKEGRNTDIIIIKLNNKLY